MFASDSPHEFDREGAQDGEILRVLPLTLGKFLSSGSAGAVAPSAVDVIPSADQVIEDRSVFMHDVGHRRESASGDRMMHLVQSGLAIRIDGPDGVQVSDLENLSAIRTQ